MEISAEIAIRMDTEDFLTPESDGALAAILDALDRQEATATFPVVAEKLRSWQRRGNRHLIPRLARHAVGYHSDTHSVHPTIAEELAGLSFAQGQAAFTAREAAGFAEVRAAFGALSCWTQPGGNWTAAALPVMRSFGVPMEFSEGWNSYLDVGSKPCHYGGLLHWSPPVLAPKPFLSALPTCLWPALQMVEQALTELPSDGPPLCVVAHPTELCTRAFWDAVNFARGQSPPPAEWQPAPLRPAVDITAATDALNRYLGELRAMGLQFVTAQDLALRYPDRAVGSVVSREEVLDIAHTSLTGANAVVRGDRALSAAEVLPLVCGALSRPAIDRWTVRFVAGPEHIPIQQAPISGPVARSSIVTAASWCERFVIEHGAVPSVIPLDRAWAAPADFLVAAAQAVLHPDREVIPIEPSSVATEAYVKAPARLHWNWPVFPEGFAPMGLWQQARSQAWTLKPALPASARAGNRDRWQTSLL